MSSKNKIEFNLLEDYKKIDLAILLSLENSSKILSNKILNRSSQEFK